jgi:hypothetical protein
MYREVHGSCTTSPTPSTVSCAPTDSV